MIADHLGWFDDNAVSIERVAEEHGVSLTKITADGVAALTADDAARLESAPKRPSRGAADAAVPGDTAPR